MIRQTIVHVLGFLAAVTFTASAADIEANYTKHCVSCHAKDGSGDTKMGKKAGAKDYREAKVQDELKDDQALVRIRDGQNENGKEKMKPFKEKLADPEIKELIAYMRKFKK